MTQLTFSISAVNGNEMRGIGNVGLKEYAEAIQFKAEESIKRIDQYKLLQARLEPRSGLAVNLHSSHLTLKGRRQDGLFEYYCSGF